MAKPSIDMCDDGKLVVLEGISHWVTHEAPERVNSLINDFLI
jgi:epoxide hydrolase 4